MSVKVNLERPNSVNINIRDITADRVIIDFKDSDYYAVLGKRDGRLQIFHRKDKHPHGGGIPDPRFDTKKDQNDKTI